MNCNLSEDALMGNSDPDYVRIESAGEHDL